ncbi:hypothetical protein B0H16DRAFT_1821687 [Mycena metata]|uniref:Uncharacterized protein n=1 Tax=Mycena metata TaxID=1033252 RepID=A0AAD7J6S5_9AGAR|nr:hypothetical protein B0H16DRAFT_1821687 [Mycena metata]
MASPSPFTRWATPKTSANHSQHPSSVGKPIPPLPPLPPMSHGTSHLVPSSPLTEHQFYGQLNFGTPRPTHQLFSYAAPKKLARNASHLDDENIAPTDGGSSPSTPSGSVRPKKRPKHNPPLSGLGDGSSRRKPSRTNAQKIELILGTIQTENWTLGYFLYQIFRAKDNEGGEIHRSSTHSQMVSVFLAGRSNETVADIIAEWMTHPDGRIPADSANSDLLYSTTVPYTDIRPVRAALTSFATQTVGKRVAVEAESAVKLNSGLHVSIGKKHPETKLRREDFGEGTIPRVQAVIKEKQPVTLYLFNRIAMRKPRKRDGIIIERKTRPAAMVVTHAIASLDFCRTDQANLLPLMRGILYLGSSAPVELINYNCRIGTMPAPDTVRRAMITLSEEEGHATQAHGKDPTTAGFLFVDNTQNYARARDLRIGRESVMNVGMSGLYMEAPDVDIEVFNLEDKRALIALNRRKDVTVDDFLGFVDQLDADVTGTLHILEVLARCIPSLKSGWGAR